jgi:hypothetical protein
LDLDIPEYEKEVVVEGWIEQNNPAQVLLTYSAPYFSDIDSVSILDYAILNASVSIKNDSASEYLTLLPNNKYFPPRIYQTIELMGEINTGYELRIIIYQDTFFATTTIPELVIPDSIWFEKDEQTDTTGFVTIEFTDDPSKNNFYRILTKRKNKDINFIPVKTSVFSDQLFNGQTITLKTTKGYNSILDIDDDVQFRIDDTIIVKFCSIDKKHYDFWYSVQDQILTSANPFASSNAQVISNIEGGLGVWGGYAAWYDTVIAK